MDLTQCTPGQLETVTTLDAPLMVSAGAGSGKTFTLTQRIVRSLLPGSDGSPAPLDSIDQVLAITFTKKAAAELRARIKGALREEGLVDQALLVDDAWVSTIHGMAARLLRENALELGIDPAFEMLSDARADELFHQAVANVMARLGEDAGEDAFGPLGEGEAGAPTDPVDAALVANLLAVRPLEAASSYERGAIDDALELLHRAQAMPSELDGLRIVPPPLTPAEALRVMRDQGLEFQQIVAAWDAPNTREAPYVDAIGPALEAADRWLADGAQAACGFDDPALDVARFRRAFYAFPATTATFGAKREGGSFFEGYRQEYLRLGFEVEGALGQRSVRALRAIARAVDDEFRALKGASAFDNGDLLALALRALDDHPAIAERYRRQFRLIMVDEFQDTDKVQVEVIRHLAAPGLANVCVVGDAQQSIYRFRGADINVFLDYRAALKAEAPDARFPELASNFRSHADVLAVVERVFAQPQSFGAGFLRLQAQGQVNRQPDPMFSELPRVGFDVVHYQRSTAKAPGVSKPEAVVVAAQHVAAHFAELRRHGATPGSMALLLGAMANAPAYVEALRGVGLDSVLVGGSVFAQAAEPQLVGALLRYAVNTQDESALLDALLSPLFAIGDDALLGLSSELDEQGVPHHRSFARAFMQEGSLEGLGLSAQAQRGVEVACDALRRFVRMARAGRAVEGLRGLLVGSGLLRREEARGSDGLAVGGNYAKAIALVDDLAADAAGIAELSAAYDAMLAASKASPGVLASSESQFVRIMTVHSSKGLQFDHVAVAEVRTGKPRASRFFAENEGDATFALATFQPAGPAKSASEKLFKLACEAEPVERLADAGTPGQLLRGLQGVAAQQEMDEARRLLYVGMTRAVKSLLVSYVTSSKIADAYQADGIFAEVHAALDWPLDAGSGVALCDYGGSAPARVCVTQLTPESLGEGSRASAIQADEPARTTFDVPIMPDLPAVVPAPWAPLRQDVRSYSSLEHAYDPAAFAAAAADGEGGEAADGFADAAALMREAPEDATALGTAFHHLAQRAIRAAAAAGLHAPLRCPAPEVVQERIRQGALSAGQQDRLSAALERWFGSALARRFAAFGAIAAEVPFMVVVEGDGSKGPLYLEGEIDGLADDGQGRALIIDYKTGGSADETPEQLFEKHRQQASCYAYALLAQGFSQVEACFIRVEREDPADPAQPQVVTYRFDAADRETLGSDIYAAYV